MPFPKSYDGKGYPDRSQKDKCRGTLPDGKECDQKRIRGKEFCGLCLERIAAQDQKAREKATREAREKK